MTYVSVFGPSELRNLENAFEAAWLALLSADEIKLIDGPAVRSRLARGIMEAAATGETDPHGLKVQALRCVLGLSRTTG